MQFKEKYLSQGRKSRQLDLVTEKDMLDPMRMAVERLRREHPNDPKGKYMAGTTIKEQLLEDAIKGKLKFLQQVETIQDIPDFDVQIKKKPGWSPDVNYTLLVDTEENNRITGFIGLNIPIEQWVNIPGNNKPVNIGKIDQRMYDLLKLCTGSTEVIAFWDKDQLHYRRLLLDLDLETTTYHPKKRALVSCDNIIRFKGVVHNEHGEIVDECSEIIYKNMKDRKTEVYRDAEFVGHPGRKKITLPTGSGVEFKLNGEGRHVVRAKAFLPGVKHRWLTCFPECVKLSTEDLEKLNARIKEMPIPQQMRKI